MPSRRPSRVKLPFALGALALGLVVASLFLIAHYGAPAYFAATGRPFRWPAPPRPALATPSLPAFHVTPSIGQTSVIAGASQTIMVSATSNTQTSATIEAWITSPKHKQVWRSPADAVTKFPAGQAVTRTYVYALPATLAPGAYQVSVIIQSPDSFTDYYVNENFAEFSLQ